MTDEKSKVKKATGNAGKEVLGQIVVPALLVGVATGLALALEFITEKAPDIVDRSFYDKIMGHLSEEEE